jgi:hypothetical protein
VPEGQIAVRLPRTDDDDPGLRPDAEPAGDDGRSPLPSVVRRARSNRLLGAVSIPRRGICSRGVGPGWSERHPQPVTRCGNGPAFQRLRHGASAAYRRSGRRRGALRERRQGLQALNGREEPVSPGPASRQL